MHTAAKEEITALFPLAATLRLSENSHRGHRGPNATLHQAIAYAKPLIAPGLPSCLYDSGRRSRCTGKERDSETGLDYFGARYLSSAQGRFISPDAVWADQHVSDPQSWNMFAYARNNPLRFTDANGRACKDGLDEKGGACFATNVTHHTSWFRRALGSVGSFFKSAAVESTANTFLDTYNLLSRMSRATYGTAPPQQPRFEPSTTAGSYGQMAGMIVPLFIPGAGEEEAGAKVLGIIQFSSKEVATAAKELEAGAEAVQVGSKAQAEELFLRLYQGDGYRNTTGFVDVTEQGAYGQLKDFFGGKQGTYHWDTAAGHGPLNPRGEFPHIQIHTFSGATIRISYGPK